MVKLYWLGQMGFLIKTQNTTICIDYYASPDPERQTPAPIPAEELRGIDLFIGTHDHIDHIDHPAWRIWAKTNPEAKFLFPRMHREAVLADGVKEQNAIGLNDGESIQIWDFVIHAVAAAHEFLGRDERTGLYPYLQFVIEGEDVRIHHAGDTVRYEGMLPKLKTFGPMDVQILPINGRDARRYRGNCIGNMTYQEAADLAGEMSPGLVFPGHWDMFADNGEDPRLFADYVDAKYGERLKCKVPRVMEEIRIGEGQNSQKMSNDGH